MHTPERESRRPAPKPVRTSARKLAATASIAAAAIVGATAGANPVSASTTERPANAPVPARLTSAAPLAAPAITPIATLKANHSSVKAGSRVTFTVTERTRIGTPVSYAHATFYVHAHKGWEKFSTRTLSRAGSATVTFHPGHDHAYRVEISAASTDGATANETTTNTVTVTMARSVAHKASSARTAIGARIVATAARQKGKPYRYGAAGPNAFDCSGLVMYVFSKFGISLPHNSTAQLSYGRRVARNDARPGDLVFVMSGSGASHVAIYAGNGYWWEAPHTGASVRRVKIWSSNVQFRRLV